MVAFTKGTEPSDRRWLPRQHPPSDKNDDAVSIDVDVMMETVRMAGSLCMRDSAFALGKAKTNCGGCNQSRTTSEKASVGKAQ
jgi:hypothetical protein